MPQIAFTLRIGQEERAALKHLSRIERRPINQLLNEAIRNYLRQKGERGSPKLATRQAAARAPYEARRSRPTASGAS